jgi:gliding motility-associated lipoprotein GldD
MKSKGFFVPLILLLFSLYSCSSDYTPKPRAYFYVDMPKVVYRSIHFSDSSGTYLQNLPFEFDVSDRILIENRVDSLRTKWFDLNYYDYNARIYCSYFSIDKENFSIKSEESRRLAYFHKMKADGVEERMFSNPGNHVYGVIYEIKGNVASPIQFVITDSVSSFFRGSLYFNNLPNADSIAPVLAYISEDIQIIMESFRWKQ